MTEAMKKNVATFVETAYTLDQIERAIEEEKRLGIRNEQCAFLGVAPDAVTAQMSKKTDQTVRNEISGQANNS